MTSLTPGDRKQLETVVKKLVDDALRSNEPFIVWVRLTSARDKLNQIADSLVWRSQ